MNVQDYILEIKSGLIASPAISSINILEAYTTHSQGYFRARLDLVNDDFMEISEFFVVENYHRLTKRYRYQWMDQSRKKLRKRWDNVEHYPDIDNFPHHVHVAEESIVKPGKCLGILELIRIIENEIMTKT